MRKKAHYRTAIWFVGDRWTLSSILAQSLANIGEVAYPTFQFDGDADCVIAKS